MMSWTRPVPVWKYHLYRRLLSVRPAQMGKVLKRVLFVQRRAITLPTEKRFWIDPVSVFGLHLIDQGVYEPAMTHLVKGILRPGDVFVDVGGNEGYFSVIASGCVSDGSVLCIEPQSRLLPIIEANAHLNNVTSIAVEQVALADVEGKIKLYLRPSTNTGASSLFPHWRMGRIGEEVVQTTLDCLLQKYAFKHVRLLKCDCEGAEYLVVKGGKGSLAEHRISFISMEYHPGICGLERCKETDCLLRSAGYVLSKVQGLTIYHIPGLEKELEFMGKPTPAHNWYR